ncbi:hypothetical protein D9M68_815880 [compost metagenome]
MDGRVGVVGADGDLELRQHARGFFGAFAEHRQRSHALAVQAEALGERSRDKEHQTRSHELADDRPVFGDPVAKTLVGHVKERCEVACFHHRDHLVPLLGSDVVAGGIVATGM